jgi:hypothetical protein
LISPIRIFHGNCGGPIRTPFKFSKYGSIGFIK